MIDDKLISFLCCNGSIFDSLLWAPLLLLGSNYSSPKIHINVVMGLNKGRIAEKLTRTSSISTTHHAYVSVKLIG